MDGQYQAKAYLCSSSASQKENLGSVTCGAVVVVILGVEDNIS